MYKSEFIEGSKIIINQFLQGSKLIAGSGGSCSGKSEIVKFVKKQLNNRLGVIPIDAYYKNGNINTNFDHPDSLELDLVLEHIYQLKKGNPINVPIYNFNTHTREGVYTVFPAEFILLEGLFALNDKFRPESSFNVFMDAKESLILERRIKRDVEERGRTKESVIKQYYDTVKPMYIEFVKPQMVYADLIIENNIQIKDLKN